MVAAAVVRVLVVLMMDISPCLLGSRGWGCNRVEGKLQKGS
jgi:hypothetical protein